MNFTYYKYCLLLLGSIFLTAVPVLANDVEDLNQSDRSSSSFDFIKGKSDNRSKPREYTFKAPDSDISNRDRLGRVGGYKVEVHGNSDDLLQQVKNIEPTAFIKENTIQVGIFARQNNAEDLVRQLAAKGLRARIVTP